MQTGLKKAGLSVTLVLAVAVGAAALRSDAGAPRIATATGSIDPARAEAVSARAPDALAAIVAPAAATAVVPDDRKRDVTAADVAGAEASGAAEVQDAAADSYGATLQRDPLVRAAEPAMHIVVSIDKRWLWLILGRDTLLSAPVAVGMNRGFEFAGRRFHFSTPRGRRTVLSKAEDPVWTVPEWHYYERARQQGLDVVRLHEDSRVDLSDGTVIVVRGEDVGRINHFGNFWPFTPGNEIIFDGTVFIPPMNTRQRRVPDALGPYKLDMGDGYLIHGTHIYNEQSVGRAVSHGCVRMNNEDLERLYFMVEPGTPVIIR